MYETQQVQEAAAPGADCGAAAPRDGAVISGLWLEGAAWDAAGRCLAPPPPGVMISRLPAVRFVPRRVSEGEGGGGSGGAEGCYACPLYKTSARCAGVDLCPFLTVLASDQRCQVRWWQLR